MKHTKLIAVIMGATMAMASYTASAANGTIISKSPATAQADITFSAATELTNTLTPVAGLTAGLVPAKTVVANGQISSSDSNNIAIAFTSGFGSITGIGSHDGKAGQTEMFKGKNNSANTVILEIVSSMADDNGLITMTGDTREFTGLKGSSPTYTIETSQGVTSQHITADTYTVSVDAVEFTN